MRSTLRRLAAMSIGLVVAVSLVVSVAIVAAPAQPANAASGSDFNPGMIISDSLFFNGSAMTVAEIQAFLNAKGRPCLSGYTCLKSYRQTTTSKSSDPMCASYAGAANESSATIIYKVARACNVSPKVILVTLEKEQGLVTRNNPTDGIYRKAMGFGCPDTASCDSQFYGFFNQIYKGAWGFQRYTMPAGTGAGTAWYSNYSQYAPGKTVTIQYHPNAACGSSKVYIQNKATGSLYTYTPYRPNAASLGNMYGTGDGCSSYGNRNFWRMYTDWFGSTTGAIQTAPVLASLATSAGLGAPTAMAITYADGGIGQSFKNGWAYWHKSTGAFRTNGDIGRSYIAAKGPIGALGYPTANPRSESNGAVSQAFQKGTMYWTSTLGSHYILTSLNDALATVGGVAGKYGYPVGNTVVYPGGGQGQRFQAAWLFWSTATGLDVTSGAIGAAYSALGGPGGALGYPLTTEAPQPNGRSQAFQNGTLYWTSALGARHVLTSMNTEFVKAGGVGGAYGYPIGNPTSYPGGGQGQSFQNARLYWSAATGLDAVSHALGQAYASLGGPAGDLGYPIATEVPLPSGGTSQAFQKGTLYSSATVGTFPVLASLHAEFVKAGGIGTYGYPIGNPTVYADGGQGQRFQKAWLYWSTSTGLDSVSGAIGQSYASLKGPAGVLGYPLAATVAQPNGGRSQAFQKGTLYWSAGLAVRHVLTPLNAQFVKLGGTEKFGYPIGNPTVYADGGQSQRFQKSWLSWSPATGLGAVSGAIDLSYAALGGPQGVLGYPVAVEAVQPNGTVSQAFQKGTLYSSAVTGTFHVFSSLNTEFVRAGGVAKFGQPVGIPTVYADGGQGQRFAKAWLYWSSATGLDAVGGAIGQSYAALRGPSGVLGYPLAADVAQPNGRSQAFQQGTLYWTSGLAVRYVPTSINAEFVKLGGVAKYGYPIGTPAVYPDGGQGQAFQKARLYWSAGTGLDAVAGALGTSYDALGGPAGTLGYPLGAETVQTGGRSQAFQKGTLYSSILGTFHVPASLNAEFLKAGSVGKYGYPIGNPTVYADGGQGQRFAKAWLYWSTATGLDAASGAIGQSYASLKGPAGVLGYPVAAEVAQPGGGKSQAFQKGTIYWASGLAARYVPASINAEFVKAGGVAKYGYPIGTPAAYADGGQGQAFQKAWLYWSTATGLDAVALTTAKSYELLRGPAGVLGYPTGSAVAQPNGGTSQAFQKGTLYVSATGAAFHVLAALDAEFVKAGGVAKYGYPVGNPAVYADGGQGQRFQKASLYWSTATGLDAVGGAIGVSYAKLGGPAGVLGYPIAAEVVQPNGGRSRAFQKGTLYWSSALGVHYVLASLDAQYVTVGGAGGRYGYPIANTTLYPGGGQGQRFQKAWLYWSPATGLDASSGAIGQAYAALRGPSGALGYPLAAEKAQANAGRSQSFQKGTIYWSLASGIRTVLTP